MNAQDEVTYWAYATGWRIVRALPERQAYAMFDRFADLAWRRRGGGVQQLEKNLRRVLPDATDSEIREVSHEGMRSYLRYWCDAFRLPSWTPEEITHRHRAINAHYLQDALDAGDGVVFAVPHAGNYDLTGAWASIHFAQVISVAERLRPERLYEEFLDFRRALGMKILPHAGAEGVFDELVELVRGNGLLALLADRDLSRHGVQVEFFGEPAKMPIGPAAISLLTGAPLLACSLYYEGPRAHVHVFPPVERPAGDWTRADRLDDDFIEAAHAFTQSMAVRLEEGISAHPGHWHMLQPVFLADLDPPAGTVRVGIVCPYDWTSPGGVKAHVHDQALALQRLGHEVSVLAPVDDDDYPLEPFVVDGGKPVSVPYNGSVAKVNFGPVSAARVRRWIKDGDFDVLHVHEPASPTLSVLACWAARGPIVATWHSSQTRSRALTAAYYLVQTAMEKISARIAVSEAARQTLVKHLGGDAVLIPNGVTCADFEDARPLDGYPRSAPTLFFIGRIDEPRKGLHVLLEAMPAILEVYPDTQLLVAGPGDQDDAIEDVPEAVSRQVRFLGLVSDADKVRAFASADIYVAPNTGGESFGIVLLEAMAAGTPVVASDLEAFARVLEDGRAGAMFTSEDSADLARTVIELLGDPARRETLRRAGRVRARQFDWAVVAREIEQVYESVTTSGERVENDMRGQFVGRLARPRDEA